MTRLTICMYGAASDRINSIYINAANELGKEIAKRHHKLIYGGGASGLMGACASGVLENGGEVTGVVPTFMNKFEPIKSECTEIVRTETMSLQKKSWKRMQMHSLSPLVESELLMNSSRYLL